MAMRAMGARFGGGGAAARVLENGKAAPPSPGLLPGVILLCQFPPHLRYYERILFHHLSDVRWIAGDEVGNPQRLDLSVLTDIKFMLAGRVLPDGVTPATCVRQEDTDRIYTHQDVKRRIEETADIARTERIRLGIAEATKLAYVTEQAVKLEDLKEWSSSAPLRLPEDHSLVIAEMARNLPQGRSLGDVLKLDGKEVGYGSVGIKVIDDIPLRVQIIKDADKNTFAATLRRTVGDINVVDDPRILPLEDIPGTKTRGRSYLDAIKACVEEAVLKFPLEGPRTAKWCCEFYVRKQMDPVDYVNYFITVIARLEETSYGVEELRALAGFIRAGLTWDQYDVTNSLSWEKVFRRKQMILYHWRQKAELRRVGDASQDTTRLDPLTKDLVQGTRAEGGDIMVAPSLLEYIKRETTLEVDAAKAERKLREERALAKKK